MITQRPRYSLINVIVKDIELISPHMKRITVDGCALADVRNGYPAQWLKVFPPRQGDATPVGRAYTIRRFDESTNELKLDFVLHGDSGPVSAWASRVDLGDHFEISRPHPRSGYAINPAIGQYFFWGDETALPAIGAILEALSGHVKAQVLLQIARPADKQLLRSAALLDISWMHGGDVAFGNSVNLESIARDIELQPASAYWGRG